MKRLLAICLAFVMVIGLFGAVVPADASAADTATAKINEVWDESNTSDKHLRMQVTTTDTLAEGTTVSGSIYMNGSPDSSLSLYKYAGTYDGGIAYYVVFTDAETVTTGATLKIGGTYVDSSGNAVEFEETTFVYMGTYWVRVVSTANSKINEVWDESNTSDKHLRMQVTTTDTLAEGTTVSGSIYMNGSPDSSVSLYKYAGTYDGGIAYYVVFTDAETVTTGTILKIGGTYVDSSGNAVKFEETTFTYNGSYWEIFVPTANAMVNQVVDTSITSDKHIRMTVTTDDTLGESASLTGTFYVNGEASTTPRLAKYTSIHYVVYMDNVEVTEGTTLKLCGVYQTSDGRKVEFAETTFVYNGSYWEIFIPIAKATVNQVVDTSVTSDKHIRMTVTTDDTLGESASLTGTFYVNGEASTVPRLAKYTSIHYVVYMDNVEVTEGTTLKLGGIYKTADDRKVQFEETTFTYIGSYWVKGDIPTVTVRKLDAPTSTDGIRMYFDSSDKLPDGHLSGEFKVNGAVNSTLELTWVFESYHVIWYANPQANTTIEFGGYYTSSTGAVFKLADTILKFNGTRWVVTGEDTKQATFERVVDDSATDTLIRFYAVTNGTIPKGVINGDIYVNGAVREDRHIYCYDATGYYYINMGTEVVERTKVTIGGTYIITENDREIEFTNVSFQYDGNDWKVMQTLSVGTEKEGIINIAVESGDKLPTGYVQDKYIIRWNVDTYTDANTEYVADYIDLDMLNVHLQKKDNDVANTVDVRYIASVDKLAYKKVGFIFSLNNVTPTYDADPTRSFQTVYQKLIADNESLTATQIYQNDGCSPSHLFAFAMEQVPVNKTIYVRAFVELSDGTIVCGDTKTVTVDASGNVQ